jgi:hypothetical protein
MTELDAPRGSFHASGDKQEKTLTERNPPPHLGCHGDVITLSPDGGSTYEYLEFSDKKHWQSQSKINLGFRQPKTTAGLSDHLNGGLPALIFFMSFLLILIFVRMPSPQELVTRAQEEQKGKRA